MSISNMLAPAGTDMAWLDLGEKPKLLHDRNSHSSLFRPIMAPQHVGTKYIARLPVLWGGFWSRTSTHGPRPSTHSAAQSSGAGAASAGVCHQLICVIILQRWCPRPGTPATGQVRRALRCISEHTRSLARLCPTRQPKENPSLWRREEGESNLFVLPELWYPARSTAWLVPRTTDKCLCLVAKLILLPILVQVEP